MMLSLALCLLPAFVQGAGPSGPAAQPARAVETPGPSGPRHLSAERELENVQRVYDLRALAEERHASGTLHAFFPLIDIDGGAAWDGGETYQIFNSDEIFGLLYSYLSAEIEYEGRGMSSLADERLMLVGPESLHADAHRLLEFLGTVTASRAELTIDVVVSRGKELGSPEIAGLVSLAEVDQWLMNGVAGAERSRHVVEVAPGGIGRLASTRAMPVVLEWDVEIAQGSAMHDPVTSLLRLGRQMRLAIAPSRDGLLLTGSILQGELIGALESRSNRQRALLGSEAKHEFVDVHSNTQSVTIRNRSASINTALGADQALVLRFDMVGGEDGSFHEAVVIRRTGGDLPILREFTSSKGRTLTVLDSSVMAPPHSAVYRLEHNRFPAAHDLITMRPRFEGAVNSTIDPGNIDMAILALEEARGVDELHSIGSWLFAMPRTNEPESLGEDGRAVPSFAQVVDDLAPVLTTANVALELRRNGPSGEVLQRASCAIRSGAASVVVVGVERSYEYGYDVEVAQHAGVVDPETRISFEGLACELQLAGLPGGSLRLDVNARASSMIANERFKFGGPLLEYAEQPAFMKLELDESLRVAAGETERRFVLGNQWSGAGSDGLTLVVTVRR